MTREERDKTIRILQWLHDNNFLFRSTEEDVKYATKLAIQELEQELSGDAVSRKAILNTISELNAISFYEAQEDSKECYYEIKQAIENLSPVNPQPTGHWILTSDDDYEYCTCSECGYQNGENWMIGSQIKFCQECGARMIKPQESEDKEKMRAQLVIEYINGDKEEIYCDDYSEGKTSLMYYIRFGEKEGEYHIPYSSIKRWSAHRF